MWLHVKDAIIKQEDQNKPDKSKREQFYKWPDQKRKKAFAGLATPKGHRR